ncbi:hypothetical protein PO909_026837 [Leuciscus waleckii]
MDLINWSLNAIDTIFSTRSLGSWEPDCPAGTFAAGYTMDTWERWRVVCLAALSVEDIEDIYLFGTMITGHLLFGLGIALVYRGIKKTVTAVQNPIRLPVMIEAVGRPVSTQTVTMNHNMDNILEKLTALQTKMDQELCKLECGYSSQDQTTPILSAFGPPQPALALAEAAAGTTTPPNNSPRRALQRDALVFLPPFPTDTC